MNEDRRLRYRDKILWIQDRASLIDLWLGDEKPEDLISDTKTLLAIFKAFQEIVEATMDIIAMCLRDMDIPSRDDYSNINRIDLFSFDQKQLLREMNGMRNRIIHRYNGTDEVMALSGIAHSLPHILSLIPVVEAWILRF
ncbi:MAG TPA: DUF86 domain-containing protein [Methanospirillum sp.]|nr:DUF86 domain-containing protein [Methanospirillum sp.]